MKFSVMIGLVVSISLFLCAGVVFASNGDRSANGNLGVETSTPRGKAEIKGLRNSDRNPGADMANPAEKAEINDKKGVDGNPGDGTKNPSEKPEIKGNEKR